MIRLLLALMATLLAGQPVAREAASVAMPLQRVSEHVYYVQGAAGVATDNEGFVSNAGVVVTGDGVIVFDALGTPALARLLLQRIAGVTEQPVTRVIVSHYHADHIYGLQVFREIGAQIVAPVGVNRYLQSDAARNRLEERRISLFPWVDEDTYLVVPDLILERGERFSQGGLDFTIDVIGAAHSDGDLTLYVENDRVLFSGDIIFEGRIPFIGNADTRHWLRTLERMETGGLAALVPGHGPANTRPAEAITLTRRYLAFMRDAMRAAVDELEPFEEAYRRIDWSPFRHLPAFEEGNRINAYGVYLSLERELLETQ